jgi:exonuclease SbcC
MKLTRLRLCPFAGVADRSVTFGDGLTMVLGPNEAGKSTLMAALRLVLFMPAACGKRRFKKEVAPFMPLAGGNTIRVELSFTAGGGQYGLARSWGEEERSELTLPDGNLVTGDRPVQRELERLLVLREGTWQRLLFSGQSAVAEALAGIGPDGDALTDLAAILRRAIFETDGISIERLEQSLEKRYAGDWSHWDRQLDRPENDRGIDKPYQKEVGRVLAAHYRVERARRSRDAALAHEQQLDLKNEAVRERTAAVAELEAYVEANRRAAEDARQRSVLELKCRELAKAEEELRGINTAWPATEQQLKGLEERRAALATAGAGLAGELEKATAAAALLREAEILARAEDEERKLRQAEEALGRLPAVDQTALREAADLDQELRQLAAGLKAGRISLTLTPSAAMEISARGDLDDPRDHELAAGQALELEAGRRISLEHPEWTLLVSSGEAGETDPAEHHDRLAAEFGTRLESLGFETLGEAVAAGKARAAAAAEADSCRQRLDAVLDGVTIETLRERLAAGGGDPGGHRPVELIAREQGINTSEAAEVEREATDLRQRLEAWQSGYGSVDKLLDELLARRAEVQEAEQRLAGLAPLPDGVADGSAFVAQFERTDAELREANDALNRLKLERLDLQAHAPDETLEEAGAELSAAEADEQRVRREALALDRIRREFAAVREALDGETLDPWTRELERVLPLVTAGRFTGMESSEGGAATLADGTRVPADRLSAGTRAGLGLAVRLSVASHLLRDAGGFLILDDPMVDLDPDRQANAASVIGEFADANQTIIFTCHPDHARLLGGQIVPLGPPGPEDA